MESEVFKVDERIGIDFSRKVDTPRVETEVAKFIRSVNKNLSPSEFYWLNTIDKNEIITLPMEYIGLGNTHRINDIKRINKFFEEANRKLQKGQFFLVCMETKDSRRLRILGKYPKIIRRVYYTLDFIVKRVFPKTKLTRKAYFWITKGKNRVLSLTEGLGRLVSCGFEIINYQQIGYLTYVISRKNDTPAYDLQPTYGALVRLSRVGKNGKLFNVYKLRTMHPYSEYLQDFAFQKNNLQDGGKIRDDFRVTGWGKIFRKLWIDELPMLINFFKGEMKLVGVRPLSRHYFNLYPESLQNLRIKAKPGLVPPFYSDLPKTLPEIIESEKVYLENYFKHPLKTDIKYFFKACYNILIKRVRSK